MNHLEQNIIGLIIKDPDLLNDCQLITSFETPFSNHNYNLIFKDMLGLYAQTGAIDKRELMRLGKEKGVQLELYMDIIKNSGFKENLNSYVSEIYDSLVKRELSVVGHKVINCLEDQLTPCERYLHDVRSTLDSIESRSTVSTGLSIPEAVKEVIDKAIKLSDGNTEDYIKTGILSIDRIITGFARKTMSVIGARPSVGKSALGLTIMSNMDLGAISTGFISVEMSEAECVERIMQSRSGVSMDQFKNQTISKGQLTGFMSSGSEISSNKRMQIVRTTSRGIANIRSIARKMKNVNPDLSIIFIDYLQKIKGTSGDKRSEVGEVSAILTDLASDLNIHVCCMAQLNRDGDQSPQMKHLKESGDIEQDASYILLVDRDLKKQYEGELHTEAQVYICKNRTGRTGLANIKYNCATTRFYDDIHSEEGF